MLRYGLCSRGCFRFALGLRFEGWVGSYVRRRLWVRLGVDLGAGLGCFGCTCWPQLSPAGY